MRRFSGFLVCPLSRCPPSTHRRASRASSTSMRRWPWPLRRTPLWQGRHGRVWKQDRLRPAATARRPWRLRFIWATNTSINQFDLRRQPSAWSRPSGWPGRDTKHVHGCGGRQPLLGLLCLRLADYSGQQESARSTAQAQVESAELSFCATSSENPCTCGYSRPGALEGHGARLRARSSRAPGRGACAVCPRRCSRKPTCCGCRWLAANARQQAIQAHRRSWCRARAAGPHGVCRPTMRGDFHRAEIAARVGQKRPEPSAAQDQA